MSSKGRTRISIWISAGFVASALVGYSIRRFQEFLEHPALSAGASSTWSQEPGTRKPAPPASFAGQPVTPANGTASPIGRDGDGALPGSPDGVDHLSTDGLIAALRSAAESHDSQRFWIVAAALGPLGARELERIKSLLDEHRKDLKAAELFFGELVHYGGTEGLDWIAGVLMDGATEPRLRNAAVEALGGIPLERREQAVPILKELLKSGLRFDELAGAQTLGWLLGPGAVAGLIEVLDGWVMRPDGSTPIEKESWDELNIMNGVLKAIQDFASADDLDVLAGLFDRRLERGLQALLCQILCDAAAGQATETMLNLLRHPPDGAIRDVIAETLGKSVGKDDVPKLRAALEAERDARVQRVLASLLARLQGADEMRPLVERALDPASGLSPDVLIEPLLRAKSKDMAPLMLDLLRGVQGDYSIVRLARGILGLMGQEEGSEKLMALAVDGGDYRMISEVARAMLEQDPDHDPRRLLAFLERSSDSVQRGAIADVLNNEREAYASSSRSGEVISALTRILANETEPSVQERFASAIANLGPEGRGSLGELLARDGDVHRRLEVLRSLERLPSRDTASLALRVLREDPSPEVRAKAVRIAGASSHPSIFEELSSVLGVEEDFGVRTAIEDVLKRHGKP